MAEATSEHGGQNGETRVRATRPPQRRSAEADPDVENYRDEYDFKDQDRRRGAIDHRR
ncbi:MAG: hypothetical protein ACJ78X_07855 [Myxococcales bacterium]